jgi:sulfoxide reductase heme-binding subunit YedZ
MTLKDSVNAGMRRLPTWPVYVCLTLPMVIYFWWGLSGQLGADPVKAIEHQYGKWALQLLIATLLVSPMRRWLGISLLKFRRALGLMAFAYVVAHLLVWLILDMQFFWTQILADIAKRPYITIGMLGFVLLIPMAVTSTNRAIRRLGPKSWTQLHRLGYAAAILGAIHYLMVVKAWPTEPILYAVGVPILVFARFLPRASAVRPRRTA